MEGPDGDDLLKVLDSLNIDLGNISSNPNVINAWFDSDCPDTRKLLNWITTLSPKNYVSPLELTEFEMIENKLSATQCAVELRKLNDNYISILNTNLQSEEISYIADEIALLETENEGLNQLVKYYERKHNNISLELSRQNQKEINSNVACKKLQESCEELCDKLDKSDMKLQSLFKKCNANINSESPIIDNYFSEDVNNINFSLAPIIEMCRGAIDESDDWWLDTKETYRKRIFCSQQKYLGNKVEIESLEKVLDYLYQFNIRDLYECLSLKNAKDDVYENEMSGENWRDSLCKISSNVANYHIQQIQSQDTQRNLERFRKIFQTVSNLITNITQRYSYYLLTIYIQLQEKKRVEFVSEIYRTAHTYVSEELSMCEVRTEQMEQIIGEYKSYMQKPIYERWTVLSSIAKMLSCDDCTLTSIVDAIGNIKAQINTLELALFTVDMKSEDMKANNLYHNIKVLKDFLTSGPTYGIILVPLDLRKCWQMVKKHLQKESETVEKAARIFREMKSMTEANKLKIQLWTNFLTQPQKLDSVLKKAEADFNQRNTKFY
ncbi:uncharacterized protein LOC109545149 isoform X2 [Dendroctonus ponderosae]|uniref:HAUS augmin-like complex subunit 3 N-terminal domain-containing protein n=1 Tax=Dendroctonus ponderosae TaxID=77166 RepID=A0AAR5QDC5_DENPD|nr:uncharacterized protein LOC109545149 isoform X2 [Dendroctonus ponderosae]